VLANYGEPLRGALLMMDLRNMQVQRLKISHREGCPDCSHLVR
jgi:molybdopterin/thiamine biosynthesis adenylyltransferase